MSAVRVAALADLHVKEHSQGELIPVFNEISEKADVMILCGDLTDEGLVEEAEVLINELQSCTIPIGAVLGNHDFASDNALEIRKMLIQAGVKMLDEEPFDIKGVGFAGVKGFGGGFDNHILGPFGEKAIKDFVFEAVNESLRLEEMLSKLQSDKKVVALHYSPIPQTVEGEPKEIYPFLGCSRLVEPVNRFSVTAVFHGHAHYGSPEGMTDHKIPVYNVSIPVLQKTGTKKPYRIVEI
jgi:Icc-related predicted phosphoesterase